jgi:hypothetical protein
VANSPRSGQLLGRREPRLYSPPLRKLTRRTTAGYEAIQFAQDVLGVELVPWQRWWLLHALELHPSGGFRYRTVLTLVGRQSGKTHLLKILALYFMYVRGVRLVLGSAQSLDIARESWAGAVAMAQGEPELAAEIPPNGVRHANGEQCLTLTSGARYRITASTRSAGRGLSVDLLILDELREHADWGPWAALSKTTMARPDALTVAISNAGDDRSIVLNHLRESALAGRDETIGLFEWSAPQGCDLDDPKAWAQANPGLGYVIPERVIRSNLATDPPAIFRTECLCQKVDTLDQAIDLAAWRDCADPSGTLDRARDRVAACIDVAPDGAHVTLTTAATLDDGRVRVDPAAAWNSTDAARYELPGLLDAIQPRVLAWYPSGPAAALAAVLRGRDGAMELKGAAVTEACQGFADLVAARQIVHPGDPLQDAHVAGAQRYPVGDGWRFVRRGAGHVDAAYAAAGAAHAALTVPYVPKLRPRVVAGRRPRPATGAAVRVVRS